MKAFIGISLEKKFVELDELKYGKKLIVISGDSGGALNAKPFCEVANDGVVYIANGIGDVPTDTVLKINYDKNLKLF